MTNLETYLANFTESDWLAAVETLLPEIHEVDKNAVQIWFRFYPLSLKLAIDAAEDRDATLHSFGMQGNFDIAGQIDTSHHFLYGHRYWKTVKAAIEAEAVVFTDQTHELAEEIKQIAILVAEKLKADRKLVNAIVAVGLATLNQVGLDAFKAAAGEIEKASGIMSKSPDAIVTERATDDSQGIFGFLKTVNKKFSVNFASLSAAGKFAIMQDQEVTGASANDRSQNWQAKDERCWEGPVPVECTAASCGTCWVGVLGGQDKLTDVSPRERRQMKIFGYNQPDEPKPFIRLSCQAIASGNVSIVIPPWNAIFGKKIHGNVEDLVLQPATTSAKVLRETIASATSDE
ncbi:MAG TPA: 2Fe-2S iron-sulfur cluster-binding protein [Pyrinomonadaceae bacterium]|nr:(2Fe-2S)-binding protein [Chloracidobacterium sp.]MBP9935890.1 (2Fe-2S)-binding protein [Pyrinomonadaceae bacterium]MBL0239965.1 (2Fe-2S)-binding protein [Chloracidobacterium sp.]HQX55782.1 2Fe-2S iron-sulfur cluster-binding protein [Pyrinomonadaceae bacterium]HQY68517.1 2Fe-2S iron-sulfur cluster-binding protein [Pyrinomonadaceae bacterium]